MPPLKPGAPRRYISSQEAFRALSSSSSRSEALTQQTRQISRVTSTQHQHAHHQQSPQQQQQQQQHRRRSLHAQHYVQPPPPPPPHPSAHTYLDIPTAISWCTSPVNTGNPFTSSIFGRSVFPTTDLPSQSEGPVARASTLEAQDSWLPLSFSTSLCNSGNPIDELVFLSELSKARANMASDEDYAAFLDKSSGEQGGAAQSQQSQSKGARKLVTTQSVHPALKSVKATYESDADEPFHPVSLSTSSKSLSASALASALGVEASKIEELSVKSFDPKNRYKSVVEAVQNASSGDVKVFRVEGSGARAEYYVLGLSSEHGAIVGMVAEAVES